MSKFVLPTALKELRFHFSQTGEASVPLKEFIKTNYASIKSSKPSLPILIREAYGIPPSVTARFEKGRETKQSLEGLSSSDITKAFNDFLKK